MKSEIINRIASLRNFMRKHKLSAFIIPSTDPHSGEYIPKHWEARKWISGFTGSAGTVVVTLDKAKRPHNWKTQALLYSKNDYRKLLPL